MTAWRDQRVEDIFPTRLIRARLADGALAAEVTAQILERSQRVPTTPRGELTGWQSAEGLDAWSPACAQLVAWLAEAVLAGTQAAQIGIAAWANVLRDGDHFSPHTHANAAWSGAVYLDVGDTSVDRGGQLCIRDPRAGAAMVITGANMFDSACTLRIVPEPGELIAFPAWLVHWVAPYRGARPRVSVAFNAR